MNFATTDDISLIEKIKLLFCEKFYGVSDDEKYVYLITFKKLGDTWYVVKNERLPRIPSNP